MSSVPDWVPAAYTTDVDVSSSKWGIRPELLAAVLQIESGFNPQAQSNAGAEGIAQFEPGTAQSYGVNPWDPASAIDGAAHLLSDLEHQYGSETLALAAYNGGPGAISNGQASPQTANYAKVVLDQAGGAPGGVAGSFPTLSQSDYDHMSLADLNKQAHGISPDNETAGARIVKAVNRFITDGGASMLKLNYDQQHRPDKVDPTGKAYGWKGTQADWDMILDTLKLADNATQQHKGVAGAVVKGVNSIADVVALVGNIVKFFQNAALRNRILLGALGVVVVLMGVYFALNGLDGGGGGTKIVPIPI